MLQFDWSQPFWSIPQEPEFFQIWDWWRNINNNISFQFRLFPEITNDKIFRKMQNILFWGHFELFFHKFGQKWIFLEKRALSVFKYSNYLPSCKNYKKLMKTNASTFIKNATIHENIRISILKYRLRNLFNK